MSNKSFSSLDLSDQMLRKAYPPEINTGPVGPVQVTIEKISGFELFNTRPYHNYETWSDGYRANDGTFKVQAEDLDECIKLLCDLKADPSKAKKWDYMPGKMPTELQ